MGGLKRVFNGVIHGVPITLLIVLTPRIFLRGKVCREMRVSCILAVLCLLFLLRSIFRNKRLRMRKRTFLLILLSNLLVGVSNRLHTSPFIFNILWVFLILLGAHVVFVGNYVFWLIEFWIVAVSFFLITRLPKFIQGIQVIFLKWGGDYLFSGLGTFSSH